MTNEELTTDGRTESDESTYDSASDANADPDGEPLVEQSISVEGSDERSTPTNPETVIESRGLDVFYGETQALQDVSMEIPEKQVTAMIGPSGCGKSTFLRCINRMNDLIDIARVEGELLFEGKNVYDPDVDPVALRRRIGMVFQHPNPFPKSI